MQLAKKYKAQTWQFTVAFETYKACFQYISKVFKTNTANLILTKGSCTCLTWPYLAKLYTNLKQAKMNRILQHKLLRPVSKHSR